MQAAKTVSFFLIVLFLMPLVIFRLPLPNNQMALPIKQQQPIAYANVAAPLALEQPLRAFVLFTHSHETYKPMAAEKVGLQAVYNDQANIFSFQGAIQQYFEAQAIAVEFLQQDVMKEMSAMGAKFNEAYAFVRPNIQKQLTSQHYDIVIDFHRDAVGKDVTTLKTADSSFAKVAFVVGAAHPNFEWNLAYAESISQEMNQLVPNISRGIIKKKGVGVDGIYNQDLAKNMLLIELGGIENTEQEVLKTIAVIAQALTKTLSAGKGLQDI